MRFLTWLFNLLLFVAALGFALSNTDNVELRFLVGQLSWHAPLVVFLLVFLIAGVVLGLLAAVPSLFRQRREIARLTKALRHATPAPEAAPAPVPAEPVPDPATGLGI
ncbi:MAG: LapA family protein [Burkholderiaceae bacterium]|nr:LapA family protein [Burkholderiaceae bacterium]